MPSPPDDPFAHFKARQRDSWAHFAPVEVFTAPTAARLVRFAHVRAGQRVLDVATGTGVVALSAARLGAEVTGLDLSPALLERARDNAGLAEVAVTFQEGDAEALPFPDGSFDGVLSQFGHMFAPRADVATREILRVLRPGGTVAFSTWPPEHFVGRFFALAARYSPPPPPGLSPPPLWGDVGVVRERLGDAVTDLCFGRGVMRVNALSVQHCGRVLEQTIGPVRALAESGDVEKLERFRLELAALGAEYFEDNALRQDYLMTRAIKR